METWTDIHHTTLNIWWQQTALPVVMCKHRDPRNAKMADLFTAFRINGRGPAVTHRWHFLWEKGKKKAEPVTRNNALAWRQPFCTTSGGADRHREALALSWHRTDPRLRVVTDSQVGACQTWRLSLLTSVLAISRPSSAAGPRTLTLGSWFSDPNPPPLVLCSHLAPFPCVAPRLHLPF